jgi:hypothetical protein
MPTLIIETMIQAPVELCFDLARDIEIHCLTAAHTQERVYLVRPPVSLNSEIASPLKQCILV